MPDFSGYVCFYFWIDTTVCTDWRNEAARNDLWAHFYQIYFSHHKHNCTSGGDVKWKKLFKECYTYEFCGPAVADRVRQCEAQKVSVFPWATKEPDFVCGFVPTVVKVVLIVCLDIMYSHVQGLPGTGKTSLIRSIKRQEFVDEHCSTMG